MWLNSASGRPAGEGRLRILITTLVREILVTYGNIPDQIFRGLQCTAKCLPGLNIRPKSRQLSLDRDFKTVLVLKVSILHMLAQRSFFLHCGGLAPFRSKIQTSRQNCLPEVCSHVEGCCCRSCSHEGETFMADARACIQGCSQKLARIASATAIGITSTSGRASADAADTIQAGTQLIQKDTIIGIAFGTAILALGAVTIGVSLCTDLTLTLSAVHHHHQ